MHGLMHEPTRHAASLPPSEYRARGVEPPSDPMTLRELYDGRFEVIRSPRWREQLLDRPAHKRNSETDVAEMVLAMDEGKLKDMRVFDGGGGRSARCYVSDGRGVWRPSPGPKYHEVYEAMVQLSDRMDRAVMAPLAELIERQHAALRMAAAPTEREELRAARMESEAHAEDLILLYGRLRRVGYQQGVMKRLITKRLVATREEGIREAELDTGSD